MEISSDHETGVLNACLAGDTKAFAWIVERYQSLICSLAYSATGDIGQSEDIAQETFIIAWKDLKKLRDKSRLRAWLCGIARNLINNSIRRLRKDPIVTATPIKTAPEEEIEPSPLEQIISEEEESMLRSALENIPEHYREPLVLYYREGQSVLKVAEELSLSLDVVKQRLSRGRKMLKEEVYAFVERTLENTRPSGSFTASVLAALPVTSHAGPAAVTASTTAVHSTLSESAASSTAVSAFSGALVGIAGALVGIYASISATRSDRERKFMIRMIFIMGAYISAYLFTGAATVIMLTRYQVQDSLIITAVISLCVLYLIGLLLLIIFTNRRQRIIQQQDGTWHESESVPAAFSMTGRDFKKMVYGSVGGSVIGTVSWMFVIMLIAREYFPAMLFLALSLAVLFTTTGYIIRKPERYFRSLAAAVAFLGVLELIIVNLRWDYWMIFYRSSVLYGYYGTTNDRPLWEVNVYIAGFYLFFIIMFYYLDKKHYSAHTTSQQKLEK